MRTITTHAAKTHLSRYLVAVENGEEFIVARGKKAIARLVPIEPPARPARPKVGETMDAPFRIPDSAIAPLAPDELKVWGL